MMIVSIHVAAELLQVGQRQYREQTSLSGAKKRHSGGGRPHPHSLSHCRNCLRVSQTYHSRVLSVVAVLPAFTLADTLLTAITLLLIASVYREAVKRIRDPSCVHDIVQRVNKDVPDIWKLETHLSPSYHLTGTTRNQFLYIRPTTRRLKFSDDLLCISSRLILNAFLALLFRG